MGISWMFASKLEGETNDVSFNCSSVFCVFSTWQERKLLLEDNVVSNVVSVFYVQSFDRIQNFPAGVHQLRCVFPSVKTPFILSAFYRS
jgi:hypothetical protein